MSAPYPKGVNQQRAKEEQLMKSLDQRGISLFRPTCLRQLGVLSEISPTTPPFFVRLIIHVYQESLEVTGKIIIMWSRDYRFKS